MMPCRQLDAAISRHAATPLVSRRRYATLAFAPSPRLLDSFRCFHVFALPPIMPCFIAALLPALRCCYAYARYDTLLLPRYVMMISLLTLPLIGEFRYTRRVTYSR